MRTCCSCTCWVPRSVGGHLVWPSASPRRPAPPLIPGDPRLRAGLRADQPSPLRVVRYLWLASLWLPFLG